jgi:hypothetical protein
MTAPKRIGPSSPSRTADATVKAFTSPHRARILELADKAEHLAEHAKGTAAAAIVAAHECGKALLKERAWFDKGPGRKHKAPDGRTVPALPWGAWLDGQYPPHLSKGGAARFMRLATDYRQAEFAFEGKGVNATRSGLLALELFPAKHHAPIPGDAKMPKVAAHLASVNRLAAWWRSLTAQVDPAEMPPNLRGRLLADLAPVAAILDELRNVKP